MLFKTNAAFTAQVNSVLPMAHVVLTSPIESHSKRQSQIAEIIYPQLHSNSHASLVIPALPVLYQFYISNRSWI